MRLLLAEDDPDLSRQLKSFLEDSGYAVDASMDGEDVDCQSWTVSAYLKNGEIKELIRQF